MRQFTMKSRLAVVAVWLIATVLTGCANGITTEQDMQMTFDGKRYHWKYPYKQQVLQRHHEAFIRRQGHEWVVNIKPKCGPCAHHWAYIGRDVSSQDVAWLVALKWLLVYDECN